MANQPNITIDRKSIAHLNAVEIVLERPDKPELGKGHFRISIQLLDLCYRMLDIANDYGGMERMEEIIDWLKKNKPVEEIFIPDAIIIEKE